MSAALTETAHGPGLQSGDAERITASLEAVGERAGDLTEAVYARLFADHPQMRELFVRDREGSVKGEMLMRVFEAIVDFIDRGHFAARLIQCEVVTHEGYGVPPEVFAIFFETVAATVRAAMQSDWPEATDRAWERLVGALKWYATHPDQAAFAPA